MIEQELHLIEDRGRARVGDPSLGADISDPLPLAGPGEPPPQIDHTIVDLIVVDEVTRTPIGRPILTLAIDVHTRVATSSGPAERYSSTTGVY